MYPARVAMDPFFTQLESDYDAGYMLSVSPDVSVCIVTRSPVGDLAWEGMHLPRAHSARPAHGLDTRYN